MRQFIAGGLILLAARGACADVGFWLMGTPNYAIGSPVTALSRDGGRACGYLKIYYPFYGHQAFSWSPPAGREDWGSKVSWSTEPYGMNADGSVLVGSMYEKVPDLGRPFRRIGNAQPEDLGLLPGTTMGWANAVTDDGKTIVGRCDIEYGMTGQAYRWTEGRGIQGLGFLKRDDDHSGAADISRDGRTIVGFSRKEGSEARPFSWSEEGGMVALPLLPEAEYCVANAVSADGSTAVGTSIKSNTKWRAVRWVDGQVEDLGMPAGCTGSAAQAISDVGDVVGGSCWSKVGKEAYLWRSDLGSMLLVDYLKEFGIEVPSQYRLEAVLAVSGDGTTFGGEAYNLKAKVWEGFVVTIPAPAAGALLLAPLAWRRRRG